MHSEKTGSIILGLMIGLFTIPLYRSFLGEFSVFVAIPLGLLIAHVLHKHSAFGGSRGNSRRCRMLNSRNNRHTEGRIYVDRYGHIYDPHDEDL